MGGKGKARPRVSPGCTWAGSSDGPGSLSPSGVKRQGLGPPQQDGKASPPRWFSPRAPNPTHGTPETAALEPNTRSIPGTLSAESGSSLPSSSRKGGGVGPDLVRDEASSRDSGRQDAAGTGCSEGGNGTERLVLGLMLRLSSLRFASRMVNGQGGGHSYRVGQAILRAEGVKSDELALCKGAHGSYLEGLLDEEGAGVCKADHEHGERESGRYHVLCCQESDLDPASSTRAHLTCLKMAASKLPWS
jgi:hypothetical protein